MEPLSDRARGRLDATQRHHAMRSRRFGFNKKPPSATYGPTGGKGKEMASRSTNARAASARSFGPRHGNGPRESSSLALAEKSFDNRCNGDRSMNFFTPGTETNDNRAFGLGTSSSVSHRCKGAYFIYNYYITGLLSQHYDANFFLPRNEMLALPRLSNICGLPSRRGYAVTCQDERWARHTPQRSPCTKQSRPIGDGANLTQPRTCVPYLVSP